MHKSLKLVNLVSILALVLTSSGCGKFGLNRTSAAAAPSSESSSSSLLTTFLTQLGAVTKAPSAPGTANQGQDACSAIAADSSGNVYCAGYTDGAIGEANAGFNDAFVMKLNSSGAVQWVTQLGVTTKAPGAPGTANQGDDYCTGVSVDSLGNVYCAGSTSGAISEANNGSDDAFVMKLNSSGVVQWVTQLGAATKAPGAPVTANQASDYCSGVAVDSLGNVYCAGATSGALGEANSGSYDAFIMKLNSNGVVQWVTQLGATTKAPGVSATANQGFDYCSGVSVDSSRNVYCAGGTSLEIGEANGGADDAFVIKLNSSGVIQWATQLGAVTKAPGAPGTANQQNDSCFGVSVDSSGNVYCAGQTAGEVSEANSGNYDAFIIKLNSSGVIQWVTQLGAITKAPGAPGTANQGDDSCYAVSVDSSGNVYCAGITDGAIGEANGGSYDVFVTKLNSSGAIQWATQLGATTKAPGAPGTANQGLEYAYGVAVDSSGNSYCTGGTSGALSEGGGGNWDLFVLKLNSTGAF